MSDIETKINDVAKAGMKRASGDAGSAEVLPVQEMMDADKYKKNITATADGYVRGIRLNKIKPEGM